MGIPSRPADMMIPLDHCPLQPGSGTRTPGVLAKYKDFYVAVTT
jgi:hypothetical protein